MTTKINLGKKKHPVLITFASGELFHNFDYHVLTFVDSFHQDE